MGEGFIERKDENNDASRNGCREGGEDGLPMYICRKGSFQHGGIKLRLDSAHVGT